MSDTPIPDGGEAEASPEVVGEAVAEAEQIEAPEPDPEPQFDFLEVDDTVRGKHVMVKIDGEDTPVQFDELANSYSRESVSTKRFQEAAELRKEAENALRLQQAMAANPGLTIQFLAQQAGMSVQEFAGLSAETQQQIVAGEATPAEEEYTDPLEQQLAAQQAQLQQLIQQNEQRQADEQLRAAVGQLKSTYSIDDEQAKAVVGVAMQRGLPLGSLPMIYESMQYQATQQAAAQQTADAEAEALRRQQAAAQAQQAVSQGNGVPTSATTREVTGNFTSIRDAVEAAFEHHGIT